MPPKANRTWDVGYLWELILAWQRKEFGATPECEAIEDFIDSVRAEGIREFAKSIRGILLEEHLSLTEGEVGKAIDKELTRLGIKEASDGKE